MRAFAFILRSALSSAVLIAVLVAVAAPPALAGPALTPAPTLDQVLGYSYVSGFFNLMT
jgi:hypothetical protein